MQLSPLSWRLCTCTGDGQGDGDGDGDGDGEDDGDGDGQDDGDKKQLPHHNHGRYSPPPSAVAVVPTLRMPPSSLAPSTGPSYTLNGMFYCFFLSVPKALSVPN